MNSATQEYRTAAVDSASSVRLVCMLYDRLAIDLGRAAEAIKSKDIERRTSQIKHALLVLDQLEAFLDFTNGGAAAANLSRFYAMARSRILEGQAKVDASLFEEQIRLFRDVRSAWEQVDPSRPATPSFARNNEETSDRKTSGASSLSCSV